MQENRISQFRIGMFNARVLVALGFCSIAALLTVFSFATPSSPTPYSRPGVLTKMLAANAGSTKSSTPVAVSADGRYLAFSGGFPFGCCVVGIYDRQTGVTNAEASSTADPTLGFSADGRFLVFATNGYDSDGSEDVYRLDRQTGALDRVSTALGGGQPACTGSGCVFSSWHPSISADGRYVAFYSFASNLVTGDTNQTADVFVRDMQTGVTELVSVAGDGTQANGLSVEPSISADGRYVAFRSFATNLVTGNTNTGTCAASGQTNGSDIYVHDRQTGTTELVSVGINGTQDGCSYGPSISGDGRYVAFTSTDTTLIAVDGNGARDVFVRDRLSGTTERVSVSSDGAEGTCGSSGCNKNSENAQITSDGRYVVFMSWAWNLDPQDTNQTGDVFVHDRNTGATDRVSIATDGTQGNATSGPNVTPSGGFGPAISGDGRIIEFDSFASNWLPGDPNPKFYTDVFMRDRGPALGIGALNAACSANPVTVSGWATFSGGQIASADDPPNDGLPPAANVGAELTGASLAYRPEHADLFVRLPVTSLLPSVGGAPGVLYGFKITIGGIPYEVRATQAEGFALYNCQTAPACTQVATLAGSIGTTGNVVTVSVPLSALSVNEGIALSGLDGYTALGNAASGPTAVLDDIALSPTSIPIHSVLVGIAPAATPESQVVINTAATLTSGNFSASLPPVAAGSYKVWAKACLGNSCSSAISTPLTVTDACAAPPVQLNAVVSRKTHGAAGDFDIDLPLTGSPGIECRTGGPTSDYTLVFTFLNPVTNCGSASTGTVSPGPSASQCTVHLTGVPNAQYVTVTLSGVVDSTGAAGAVSGTMGVLVGDVNASGVVTSGDTNLCKAQALQPVTTANFRADINASGTITTGDVNIIKQNALSHL
jgi:Tol biopolymer transport system component